MKVNLGIFATPATLDETPPSRVALTILRLAVVRDDHDRFPVHVFSLRNII